MEKKYVVINPFTDLRDYDHAYNVGDEFPRQGVVVNEERIAELSSSRNKQRRPLIKAVEDSGSQKPEEPKSVDSSEENNDPKPEVNPENGDNPAIPEQTATHETPEVHIGQTVTTDSSAESKKYSKEDIEAMKLNQIREIAGKLGFKISSTSKDGAVAEFMEKQG